MNNNALLLFTQQQLSALQAQLVAWQQQSASAADLTNNINLLHNLSYNEVMEGLCMKGHIRAKGKCEECGNNFKDFGHILACETCLSKAKISIPKRLYLEIFWNGKQRKIYSDNDGRVLNSYELAQRVVSEIRQKIDKHKFNPADYVAKSYQALQWEQYCKNYLARRKEKKERGELSLSTLLHDQYTVGKYITFFASFAGKDLRDIRAGDIEDFRLSLPKKLKLSSQKETLSILHNIFQEAKKREDLKVIPDFPLIKTMEVQRKWLDEEAQTLIFAHIPDRHKAIFTFMFKQGCRPGEARALQWEDVDMINKYVHIRRTFSRGEYQADRTKTKRGRILPLNDEVCEILKGMHVKGISGFVFRQERTGKPYLAGCTLNDVWDTALKLAGVPRVTLYEGTRHSFASQAVQEGVDLYGLQKFLGHTDSKMTERYTHIGVEGLQRVLDIKEGKVVKMGKRKEKEK